MTRFIALILSLLLCANTGLTQARTAITFPINKTFYDYSHPAAATVSETYVIANVTASQTDSVLVAAVTGKKIRVVALDLQAGATATTNVLGSKVGVAATVPISPTYALPISGSKTLPFSPAGWFETAVGGALVTTTGTGATTGYTIVYVTY